MTNKATNNTTNNAPASTTQTMPQVGSSKRVLGIAAAVFAASAITLLLVALVLIALGKNPINVFGAFLQGALGTPSARADVIMTALPMLLCASGLLLTFTAGLWNIGIEGQVTMGAVFASIIAQNILETETFPLPEPLLLPVSLILAMIGGALWAGIVGILKLRGGVNEIFGGVALNFIAANILLSLVNGPWKGGTSPQTAPFPDVVLLPRLEDLRLSIPAIILALILFALVYLVLRGTKWGLQIRAMGKNPRSAFLLGVRTDRNVLLTLMLCGALGGLAGAFQVLFTRGRLVPGISGGLGFLGVLIVLLVDMRAAWVLPVTLFFAIVPIGSLRLASALDAALQVDSRLGNVFQSALVLAVILAGGMREQIAKRRQIL